MKKLFTLMFGFAVTLSMFAVPQRKVFQPTPQFAKVQNELLPKAVAAQKSAKKNVRLYKPTNNAPLRSAKIAAPAAAKAPKATTNVTVLGVQARYYSSYGLFIYTLSGDNDKYYNFAFPSTGEDIITGKTYTFAEMDDYYSYWDDDSWNYTDFTAATFLKTIDSNGKMKIQATATDENGDSWNLSYDEASLPEAPKGGTYVANAVSGDYYSSTSDIQYILTVSESNLEFFFDILLPSGEKDVVSGKTYSLSDMDEEYTGGVFNKVTNIYFASASFTKTVAADGSYTIQATVVDENGSTWNLSASKAAPAPVSTQTLTLNGFVEGGSQFSQVEAANTDSTIIASLLMYTSNPVGSFTEDDLLIYFSFVMLTNGNNVAYYVAEEASFTIVWNETEGTYSLTGTLLGANEDDSDDKILFTLNLTLTGEAPKEVVSSDLTFTFQMTETEIIVTPSNNTDPWDYYIITAEDLATYYNNDIDQLAAAAYDAFGDESAAPGEASFSLATLQRNYDEGELILIVYGCDGGVTTPAASFQFTLTKKDFVLSDMTFTFTNTGSSIIVTPSNNTDPWDYDLITPEDLATDYNNDIDAFAKDMYGYYGDKYAYPAPYEFMFEDWLEDLEEGVYILVVWGANGGVTTPAASFQFTLTASSEGFEQLNADKAVIKRLENGNLIILKNGIKYNAAGAIVR